MDSWYISASTFACIFGGALLGCALRKAVGERRLIPAHETFRLTAGVVGTMTALVLGLLIATTKSSYDSKLHDVRDFVLNDARIDRSMRRYEPSLDSERQRLADITKAMITCLWREEGVASDCSADILGLVDQVRAKIRALEPQSESQISQRQYLLTLADALVGACYQLLEKDNTPIPPLLFIAVDIWLGAIFIGFGLFSPANVLGISVLFTGALILSMGIFVIVEMNEAFTGWISIPHMLMDRALVQLGRPT